MMFRLPIEAFQECPHCDLMRAWCWIPSDGEIRRDNYGTAYECKACRATWTLGEAWGAWDSPPPVGFVCNVDESGGGPAEPEPVINTVVTPEDVTVDDLTEKGTDDGTGN